jgi:uncharacterized membrane protein
VTVLSDEGYLPSLFYFTLSICNHYSSVIPIYLFIFISLMKFAMCYSVLFFLCYDRLLRKLMYSIWSQAKTIKTYIVFLGKI